MVLSADFDDMDYGNGKFVIVWYNESHAHSCAFM